MLLVPGPGRREKNNKKPLKGVVCLLTKGVLISVRHNDDVLACQRWSALWAPQLNAATHVGFVPAATSTSRGATNPVGVSNVLSISATSAHAATRTLSGQSLTTAR